MSFTWAGRQLAATTVNGETISYTYNSDGIRTSKTVDGVTTDYLVDSSTIVAQNTVYDTLWFMYDGDGTRVGFTYHDAAYYYLKNIQGDVMGIVDSNMNVVVEYSYDAWGKLIETAGSEANSIGKLNPFLYRGYYYDAETEMYYLNSRYYDPQTGRYLNTDGRINVNSGLTDINLFTYCGNNPVNHIDHTGHSWFNVLIVAAVVTVAAAAVVVAAPALAAASVAVGIGSITSAAIAATAYTVGTMATGVGFFAAGQIAVQTVPISFPKAKAETKEKTAIKNPSNKAKIYRTGSRTPYNLTPRKTDTDGLSFTLKEPSDGHKYIATTIEDVNRTGVLIAVQDGPNHVSVKPSVPGTLQSWMDSKENANISPHPYTTILRSIVWDPFGRGN